MPQQLWELLRISLWFLGLCETFIKTQGQVQRPMNKGENEAESLPQACQLVYLPLLVPARFNPKVTEASPGVLFLASWKQQQVIMAQWKIIFPGSSLEVRTHLNIW